MHKELKRLIRQAERAGWEVQKRKSGHLRWINPNGDWCTSSESPGNDNHIKALRRDLRRLGFES